MRVYHERFSVPAYWWPLAVFLIVLFGAEVVAGLPWPLAATGFAVLVAASLAALLLAGRTLVEVRDGELRAGRSRLPLAAAGEVTALDETQTKLLRGPRGDPQAFVLTRPYLKRAVYIQVTGDGPGPYWLVGSRRPEELAAAIEKSRPVARAGGVPVG